MNSTFPYLNDDNPGEILVFEDLACAVLRPGHQWTYDVTWKNDVFQCDSPYGFDALIIRDSPYLQQIEFQFGVGFIWVCKKQIYRLRGN